MNRSRLGSGDRDFNVVTAARAKEVASDLAGRVRPHELPTTLLSRVGFPGIVAAEAAVDEHGLAAGYDRLHHS